MTNFPISPQFKIAHYQLTLQILESLRLPPYKGSTLRGGFGHTFKRLVCFQSQPCDKRCQLGNSCPYGYIFETTPPANSEVLRTFKDIVRPFIIQAPLDRRGLILADEHLSFGLTLFGRGIDYLPYFISVFRELGQVGLGRKRTKYRLLSIETCSPYDDKRAFVYQAQDDIIRSVEATLDINVLARQVAKLSPQEISLNFLSPTRLKHQGRRVVQGPPFQALLKTLLGRISALSYFHCGQRLELDFRALVEQAAKIQISQAETYWEDWSRFSGRQKQRVSMGGLMGRVTYRGDLEPFLPFLVLGELVQVGKGTVFGNGWYRIKN